MIKLAECDTARSILCCSGTEERLAYHVNQRADGEKQTSALQWHVCVIFRCPSACESEQKMVMTAARRWLLAQSPVATLRCSLKRLPAGMPHRSKRKRFPWLNQCNLHMQDETNPHRREVLHLRPPPLLFFCVSFPRKPSLINWSPDNAHLRGENKARRRTGCRGKVCEKVWTQEWQCAENRGQE